MNRTQRFLACVFLACPAILLSTAPVEGGPFRPGRGWGYRAAYARPYSGDRMPGWDWWRIYPWSPYNYGRNPYNPIVVPYPYISGYPVPPEGTTYSGYSGTIPGTAPGDAIPQAELPEPTGPIQSPPPDAALIEVRVPDEFAEIRFDGERTSSVGTQRYYVTPVLEAGKSYEYAITASWKSGGRTVTGQRQVTVTAGQTARIDFTRARP